MRPTVGWAAVVGSGTIAGIGFTVSFLIATLAFDGDELAEAKLGVAGRRGASPPGRPGWSSGSPRCCRAAGVPGAARRAEQLLDLSTDVDPERDHIRGPADAAVTVVEYGDFQCPYCGQAEPAVRPSAGVTRTSASSGGTCR